MTVALAALGLFACSPDTGRQTGPAPAAPLPDHLSEHPSFEGATFPISVGHGGAKQLCPENTLECYQMALDAGASALEADLQVLADGTLVMFHDDNAFDQTGVDFELVTASFAEMRELDMGFAFTPDSGVTHPFRGMGFRVSTLQEFLEAFPGVPVLLDVKPETPEMANALVRFAAERLTAEDRVRLYIKSNDQEVADALRALEPPPRVALSGAERLRLQDALLRGEAPTLGDVSPSWVDLDTDLRDFDVLIDRAADWTRAEGHVLTASTVNDPDQMSVILGAHNVDGLVTDRPDLQSMLN